MIPGLLYGALMASMSGGQQQAVDTGAYHEHGQHMYPYCPQAYVQRNGTWLPGPVSNLGCMLFHWGCNTYGVS